LLIFGIIEMLPTSPDTTRGRSATRLLLLLS